MSANEVGERLAGKRVLITGSGRGQGRAAQELFCRQGAYVIGCDFIAGSAEATAAELREQGYKASGFTVDISDPAATKEWVATSVEEMGGLDVVYNNAGAPVFAPFAEMTYDMWRSNMLNELDNVFLVTSAAWPHLVAGGGSIINTSSTTASYGNASLGSSSHSSAKAALLGLTKQLAAEGGSANIRVNAISPGFIQTPGTDSTPQFVKDQAIAANLLRRAGTGDDIALLALYLASDESSFVTGAEFVIDGGLTAI